MELTVETFRNELNEALATYEKYIVCLDKTPDVYRDTAERLLFKAIREFERRPAHLRHGIALDRFITIILSQTEGARPMCAIYFNLSTPFMKHAAASEASS